jgi:predicted nuclease of restriction endonuclease-like (RecB) superfamily
MNKQITTKPIDVIFHTDDRYRALLTDIKSKIRGSRLQAALSVNKEVISLYWYMGNRIMEKQAETKWGDKLIETLSNDLRQAFPETHGLSKRNLELMRQFAKETPETEIAKQSVSQLPWGHIILLIQRVKDNNQREWYARQTIENGWARYTLEDYIKQGLYERQAIETNKTTNFLQRLPDPQSRLAQDLIKNPYNFDFLSLHDKAYEREIEHASIQHITEFMLALGKGFAFVGHQVPITIDEDEFFIDMLFYNLRLRCYTILEIKSTKFKPEHAGQLNFYLSAVDDLMKHPNDNPSIGILLCKSRNKVVAEYALKSIEKPIGVSEYELTKAIPEKLKSSLPTIEEIESELNTLPQKPKRSKK